MPDKDIIIIECSSAVKNILCEALRNFAYFSDNGMPATQRNEIIEQADQMDLFFRNNNKRISINKAISHTCTQAIHYHYDRIQLLLNANVDEQRNLMLNLIKGIAARDPELEYALYKDNML